MLHRFKILSLQIILNQPGFLPVGVSAIKTLNPHLITMFHLNPLLLWPSMIVQEAKGLQVAKSTPVA